MTLLSDTTMALLLLRTYRGVERYSVVLLGKIFCEGSNVDPSPTLIPMSLGRCIPWAVDLTHWLSVYQWSPMQIPSDTTLPAREATMNMIARGSGCINASRSQVTEM
jgi:hypothetical protein